MRTRRIKLRIEGANCEFWLMLFGSGAKLHRYLGEKLGADHPEDVGDACCVAHRRDRIIMVCLSAEYLNEYVIGHEAFHAAMWYMKLNHRTYTRNKWEFMWDDWGSGYTLEETLADVCGSVYSEVWSQLRKRFKVIHEEPASGV